MHIKLVQRCKSAMARQAGGVITEVRVAGVEADLPGQEWQGRGAAANNHISDSQENGQVDKDPDEKAGFILYLLSH